MPDIFVSENKTVPQKESQEKTEDITHHVHTKSVESLPEKKIEELAENELKPSKSEKHMGIFSVYCVNPHGVSFADQEKDEKILLFLRRHLITNLDWILISMLLIIVPPAISLLNLFGDNSGSFNFLNLSSELLILFLIFYYSSVFTFAFVNFLSWFYNIGLVTSRRVVDIDLVELIFKNIATTNHSLIQDVSYSQNGAIRSVFSFGDVIVQTAGQEGKFELEAVPHPDGVVHLIEDFIGKRHKSLP